LQHILKTKYNSNKIVIIIVITILVLYAFIVFYYN